MASHGVSLCRGGSAAWLFGLLLAAVLSGCTGAIEAYRSVSGANKNDPDPATAPFGENLDKAESGGYPNLASVPGAPTIATTLAERQRLAQNLTSARASTQANGGTATPGPVPPPPPIPPSIAAPDPAVAPPPEKPATSPRRAMDEPPVPLPPNTTMQTPTVAGTLPGAEPPRPAPPPGRLAAIPRPDTAVLAPTAVQSGDPQPAPPVAALPPPAVSPQVAALPPPRLPPVPVTAASLDLAPGTTSLPGETRSRLAVIAAQYKDQPRRVRIVSYASPGTGSAEQLNNFRAALDRAQLVAKALADSGIPTNKIQTEASPATESASTGRIDVQFLP
jgi:hypothetical protein